MLVDEFVSETEGDADMVVAFQHLYLAAFGAGVKVDDTVFITEVHGNYVWITFKVYNTYKTGVTVKDNGFDSLFIFNNKGFHRF